MTIDQLCSDVTDHYTDLLMSVNLVVPTGF